MPNILRIKKKTLSFRKKINTIPGDKSLSIRWVLFSSIANGKSKSFNLLRSEDVFAAINTIRKLGIKVKIKKKYIEIFGKGINGFDYKKNLVLNAENSGTLGRLIVGLIIDANYRVKLVGDKSLSSRDFKRITDPLEKFGAQFSLKNKKFLPLLIQGSKNLKPINYFENKGSAQCKSSIIFAGLKTEGITKIKAKKSRNHTELLCKFLKLPIKIKKTKSYDFISIKKTNFIKPLNYKIPADISSAAFFIVLTVLSNSSSLILENININPSRIGIITILKKMGANIKFKNKRKYKGEDIANIYVESTNKIKSINCPSNLNSGAIDEFLLIFLVAAKADGISYFKNIGELNEKESPRLKWGSKILNLMGVKTITTNHSIKIFGNPKLNINKKIIIKNYLKDHRIFMTSAIAALSLGGDWQIHDKDSVKTSFPNFLDIIYSFKNEKKKKYN